MWVVCFHLHLDTMFYLLSLHLKWYHTAAALKDIGDIGDIGDSLLTCSISARLSFLLVQPSLRRLSDIASLSHKAHTACSVLLLAQEKRHEETAPHSHTATEQEPEQQHGF
jgi:hypothetical protein